MKKWLIPLGIGITLTGIGIGIYYYLQMTANHYQFYFPADEWKEITFRQYHFDCAGNNLPGAIFGPFISETNDVWIFQEQNGELVSWNSTRAKEGQPNDLENILPDVPCSVHSLENLSVEINC